MTKFNPGPEVFYSQPKTRDVQLPRTLKAIPVSPALFDPLRGAALKAVSEGPF